jgi:hypothetical protein
MCSIIIDNNKINKYIINIIKEYLLPNNVKKKYLKKINFMTCQIRYCLDYKKIQIDDWSWKSCNNYDKAK